jgi:hypothetical protein
MLALAGSSPNRIDSFDPPLSTSRLRLIGRSGIKTARMYTPGIGIHSPRDIPTISRYSRSSTAELIAHPVSNLGHLGEISRFDAVDTAIAARSSGIEVSLAYTDGDEYFRLSREQEDVANDAQVTVVRLHGIHDQLVITPEATLQAFHVASPFA